MVETIWSFFASLKAAAALAALVALSLAAGALGAVQDVQRTPWFPVLLVLFGLCVLASALERLPRRAIDGLWAVHAGLLAAAAGGLVNAQLGYSGTLTLSQSGGASNAVATREADGTLGTRRPGFFVRCDDVRPSGPEADVIVLHDAGGLAGHELAAATLRAGESLRHGAARVRFDGVRKLEEGDRARIEILDRSTGGREKRLMLSGEPITLGDASYRVVQHAADRETRGEAVQLVRNQRGVETSFWLYAREPQGDRLARKDRFAFTFGGLQPVHAVVLGVSREPGLLVALAGLATALLGAIASVLVRQRASAPYSLTRY